MLARDDPFAKTWSAKIGNRKTRTDGFHSPRPLTCRAKISKRDRIGKDDRVIVADRSSLSKLGEGSNFDYAYTEYDENDRTTTQLDTASSPASRNKLRLDLSQLGTGTQTHSRVDYPPGAPLPSGKTGGRDRATLLALKQGSARRFQNKLEKLQETREVDTEKRKAFIARRASNESRKIDKLLREMKGKDYRSETKSAIKFLEKNNAHQMKLRLEEKNEWNSEVFEKVQQAVKDQMHENERARKRAQGPSGASMQAHDHTPASSNAVTHTAGFTRTGGGSGGWRGADSRGVFDPTSTGGFTSTSFPKVPSSDHGGRTISDCKEEDHIRTSLWADRMPLRDTPSEASPYCHHRDGGPPTIGVSRGPYGADMYPEQIEKQFPEGPAGTRRGKSWGILRENAKPALQGESSFYKTPVGGGCGAPAQDHYAYERMSTVVLNEEIGKLQKRFFPTVPGSIECDPWVQNQLTRLATGVCGEDRILS
uniref:Uncharacterized protein n=1 Tax=Chromera velia CCMP2878 TaxID=1169474 RepID=A0A0G4GPB2_9ALVE|eukprot:Cvel_22797.t1-p1 / transcript=Cvel_22797.t1 / gene=Cvel_22797 / organism=Chromera_velia_CCMP2878 / gene_product=hypothetical protein / transcript_product=hypothetical protein / location=Cvel_scaffold2281:3851-9229(-) / protein_length=479 / sequence_SO=supercontig / SO=protein_coding / is_pseudo=false